MSKNKARDQVDGLRADHAQIEEKVNSGLLNSQASKIPMLGFPTKFMGV